MLVFWTVCAALGSFWVVEIVKAVVPWPLQAWTKQALSLALVVALLWVPPVDEVDGHFNLFLLAVAGATGLSALSHRLHRFLGAAGDDHRTSVMARGVGRGR